MPKKFFVSACLTVGLLSTACQSQVLLFHTLNLATIGGSNLGGQTGVAPGLSGSQNLEQSTSASLGANPTAPLPSPTPTSSGSGGAVTAPSASTPTVPAEAAPPAIPVDASGTPIFSTGQPVSLSISPSRMTLSKKGEVTAPFAVFIKSDTGGFLDPAQFKIIWTSSKAAELSVNANGQVTAEAASGFALIQAQIENTELKASADVTIGSSGEPGAPVPPGGQDSLQGIIDFS